MKSQQNNISIEEKLDIIYWLEKVEQIVDICHNIRVTQSNIWVCTICDNADRIKGSAELGTEVFV